MKAKWILGVLFIAMTAASVAHAQSSLDDVQDLSVAKEADQLDVYDQKAMADEARKETAALEKQAAQLQTQIKSLRSQSRHLSNQVDRQTKNYTKIHRRVSRIQAIAKKMTYQRDRLQDQIKTLNSRVSVLQSQLDSGHDLEASLKKDIHDQARNKAHLLARKRRAELAIRRARSRIHKLRSRSKRLSKTNSHLEKRVGHLEAQADALQARL